MTLQELYEQMSDLTEKMHKFLDEHEDEEGNLPEEDFETYDKMERKLLALKQKIGRKEKLAKIDSQLHQPVGMPIVELFCRPRLTRRLFRHWKKKTFCAKSARL